MSVARRLINSFGATILGPAITIVIQLINVPVMLRFWGAELYGEWLLLTAIPTYLLLTDMGFGNVAGSDMTMRLHAGDREGAIETFQSTMVLVLLATLAILIAVGALIALVPIHSVLHLSAMSSHETQLTLLLLSVNVLVMLQWSVISAGYRATERYALVMLYVNCIRIVEGASFLVLLFARARPSQLAGLMLCVSVSGTAWLVYQHKRRMPWLPYGMRFARMTRVKELARPAFAFMAFPACAAISTQGMTLAVGVVLGPIAVAVFNPMRTLSRGVLQLNNAVLNSVWPELSAAFGQQNWELARRLHRTACQVALWFSLAASIVLAIFGRRIFALWTHGQVVMDVPAFYVLLAGVLAYSGWSASSAVPLSSNRHQRLAMIYLVCTTMSLALAYPLIKTLGLAGAATSLLLCDLVMSVYVVRLSNALLSDRWSDLAKALFDTSQIKAIALRLRRRIGLINTVQDA